MEEQSGYSRKYYVIFKKSKLNDWRLKWLEPNFSHVLLAKESDYGHFWIITNPMGGNIITEIKSICPIRHLFPDEVILEYRSEIHKRMQVKVMMLSCVEEEPDSVALQPDVKESVLTLMAWMIVDIIRKQKESEDDEQTNQQ